MSKYIFNVKAINTVPEAIEGAGKQVGVIEAKDIEEALERAKDRWKRNKQFRFEYEFVSCEEK